jgi:hypothetical protein
MRCCFIRGGHIADVDKLAEFSDEEAIAKARAPVFRAQGPFEGFEFWDGARVLIGHPELFAQNNPAIWPLHRP